MTSLGMASGWADGRFGDFRRSSVILSDHTLIAEIARWFDGSRLGKDNLLRTMTALADEAAGHFATVLAEAANKYANVIAITHVPPFREAAWYQGQTSSDDYLPHFACKVVGDMMRVVMRHYPNSKLLVLCGHTHGSGEIQPKKHACGLARGLSLLAGGSVRAEAGSPTPVAYGSQAGRFMPLLGVLYWRL